MENNAMRKIKNVLFVLLFLMVGFAHAGTAIKWANYSKDAFAQAKKEHRLVLIYGKAEWCHWCQKMLSTTWADPAVVQLVTAHYVPVTVDIDSDDALAKQYDINATPTIILVDPNGKTLKFLPGYSTPQEMANDLSGAWDSYQSDGKKS
jgi:thioredoxin-related protein